ncbi:MAG: ribosome biogenesis GTPase YlqF [Clostridiaceae bacterium]|jgi:ribosome biogenesis GTPase A|nr:ribosome biogenesis GTPase YlqF [Clostridiaceae bacterium]
MADRNDRNIQWYPGHMARSTRQIKEQLSRVDLLVEVADARVPLSSRNPLLSELSRNKEHLLLLSHADLADPTVTEDWLDFYIQKEKLRALAVCLNSAVDLARLRKELTKFHQPILERAQSKGRQSRPLRILVGGVPNTGKSTLINALIGKRSAPVESRPGVTRTIRWLRVGTEFELLDSPGLLEAKISSDDAAFALAASGAIKDDILPLEDLAFRLFREIYRHYPADLADRYEVNFDALTDEEDFVNFYEIYLEAAQHKGCILTGGRIDTERFARMFLADFRSGKIARISLERP